MTDYSMLPDHMQASARRYVEKRIMPESFLRAVLENDLVGAFSRADDINAANMRAYASFLYALPYGCWGSPEMVDAWVSDKEESTS